MIKSILTGVLLMLSQIAFPQDNRYIEIFYGRMFGGIVVETEIKYDDNFYKIISKVSQLNEKYENTTKKSELEITKNEFDTYYSIFSKYNESENSLSHIEEDNQLNIKVGDGQKILTIELMPVLKHMKEHDAYRDILSFLEELFPKIGLLPEYLYRDRDDNRQININYKRPQSYSKEIFFIDIQITIKIDSTSYKILTAVNKYNEKHNLVTTKSEIEITENEFYILLNGLGNPDLSPIYYMWYGYDTMLEFPYSIRADDNRLDIKIDGYNKSSLIRMVKCDNKCNDNVYKELLVFVEKLFQRAGILPAYLYGN
jgi:hypothetical protein